MTILRICYAINSLMGIDSNDFFGSFMGRYTLAFNLKKEIPAPRVAFITLKAL